MLIVDDDFGSHLIPASLYAVFWQTTMNHFLSINPWDIDYSVHLRGGWFIIPPIMSDEFSKRTSFHIASSRGTMAEAISLAKELNDMHGLALALFYAAVLGYFELNPAVVEHLASDLIEQSTRHNFAHWLATGAVCRGSARSASGDTAHGIARIEEGIGDYRAIGSMLFLPVFLALKTEALDVAGRTSEALEAIKEAEAFAGRFEG